MTLVYNKMVKPKVYYRSCTGCYESEDGYPIGEYPKHPTEIGVIL